MFLLNRLHAPCWLSTQISLFVNKMSRRGWTVSGERGCVNSRLMTRLAGYYAQLSLMMIGIDAISHGFLRTSFRNRGPPAASLENVWAAWTTNPISNRFRPHPFSKAGQINDILTDIFSTSEVRQFDVLKWLGNDPNLNANVFDKKQPNLTAVS